MMLKGENLLKLAPYNCMVVSLICCGNDKELLSPHGNNSLSV